MITAGIHEIVWKTAGAVVNTNYEHDCLLCKIACSHFTDKYLCRRATMEVKCSNLTISMTKPSGIAAFGLEITKNSSHLKDIINSDPLI